MIHVFRQYIYPRKAVFILGEGLLIYLAVFFASTFGMDRDLELSTLFILVWMKVLLITVVCQLSLYFHDLYDFKSTENLVDLYTRLIQAIGVTSIILAAIYFIVPGAIVGRWIFFISIVFLLFLLVSWRLLYAFIVKKKLFTERAIVLGAGDLAGDILNEIKDRKDVGYNIRCIVGHESERNGRPDRSGIAIRYGFEDLCDFAEAEQVSDIIVALDEKRGLMPCAQLLNCKVRGISIIDGESFFERISGKLLVEKLTPSWLIFSEGFAKSNFSRLTKRLCGFALSSVMLIILSPLLLVTVLAIKLDSRGAVLFSQERVGENEKIIRIYKFRSMVADAEEYTGPVWAEENDPRVTRVGRIIRKLRVDELPQLWNVLKGDMSFVGPRPERPFFVEKLKQTIPYYKERFSVKPGVTGWAQIKYPYGATEKDALEKLKYDLYYIKNMSFLMDFMIVFQTMKIVLLSRGSR